jgi:multidrug efflux system membrane fusion protein
MLTPSKTTDRGQRMDRKRKPLTVLVPLLLLAVLATSCSQSNRTPSTARANAPQTVPVTVALAQQEDLPIYLNGLGSVQANYTVNVKSRVDGQLVEVKFREGEFVKKGDLLAVIDPRPYQVQLDQAQAQLFRDQASLKDAQLNYERYKSLLTESGAMSQQQVDTQQSTVNQLQGTVRNDQALVDSAKLNLSYCHITAPESGRIGLRQVDPGNIVHAADANPMIIVTQLQPIAVLFTLPEDQLQTVSGRMQKGTLTVDAYSRDDQTKLTSGKLLTIDNQIDATTGTGKLKAIFENRNNELWPNQFVNIHLLLETRKNATVIPTAAVQRGPQGQYVFAVKPDKTVEVRPVTIATTEGNVAEVASGIAPNDMVVTDGQDKLQNNSRVEPHQQTAVQSPGNPSAPAPALQNPNPARSDRTKGNRGGRASASGNPNSGTSSQ